MGSPLLILSDFIWVPFFFLRSSISFLWRIACSADFCWFFPVENKNAESFTAENASLFVASAFCHDVLSSMSSL
jgi:hypothetical protein